MTRLKTLFALALLIPSLALAQTGPVFQAGPILVVNTDGSWSNPVPSGAINNTDVPGVPSTLRWGTTAGKQSGYDYTPVGTPFSAVVDGPAFLLGTFVHRNFTINAPFLTSVDLKFSLDWNIFTPDVTGVFAFNHLETPNKAQPCAFGGMNGQGLNAAGCADLVLISSPFLNTLIHDGYYRVFFTLVGFSTDGGVTTNHLYLTKEGQTNKAGVYGRLTSVPLTY